VRASCPGDETLEKVPIKATSIAGLSSMYGISKATIERAIAGGDLPVCRLKRRVIIRIKDADEWIGKSKPRKA
jgi:hypothetical protein